LFKVNLKIPRGSEKRFGERLPAIFQSQRRTKSPCARRRLRGAIRAKCTGITGFVVIARLVRAVSEGSERFTHHQEGRKEAPENKGLEKKRLGWIRQFFRGRRGTPAPNIFWLRLSMKNPPARGKGGKHPFPRGAADVLPLAAGLARDQARE